MNKKIILLISSLILLTIIVIVVFSKTDKGLEENVLIDYNPEPELFLSEDRKAYFGLAPETDVQVFGHDEGYEIYKIIKDDGESE